jgi:selenocysteine lyase/cysteine desulfurase
MLADHSIWAWDGHFYAIRAIEAMGLIGQGGVTRMGIAVYNTAEEIDYVIATLQQGLNH